MPKGNLLSARPAGQQGTARYGSQPGGLNASLQTPTAQVNSLFGSGNAMASTKAPKKPKPSLLSPLTRKVLSPEPANQYVHRVPTQQDWAASGIQPPASQFAQQRFSLLQDHNNQLLQPAQAQPPKFSVPPLNTPQMATLPQEGQLGDIARSRVQDQVARPSNVGLPPARDLTPTDQPPAPPMSLFGAMPQPPQSTLGMARPQPAAANLAGLNGQNGFPMPSSMADIGAPRAGSPAGAMTSGGNLSLGRQPQPQGPSGPNLSLGRQVDPPTVPVAAPAANSESLGTRALNNLRSGMSFEDRIADAEESGLIAQLRDRKMIRDAMQQSRAANAQRPLLDAQEEGPRQAPLRFDGEGRRLDMVNQQQNNRVLNGPLLGDNQQDTDWGRSFTPRAGQFGGQSVGQFADGKPFFYQPGPSQGEVDATLAQQNERVMDGHTVRDMPGGSYLTQLKDGSVVGSGNGPVFDRDSFNRQFAQSQGSGLRAQQAELARRAAAQGGQPEGLLVGAQPGQPQQGPQQPQGGLLGGMTPQRANVIASAMQRRQGRQNRLYGPDPQTLFAMNNPREFAAMQAARVGAQADAQRNVGLLEERQANAALANAQAQQLANQQDMKPEDKARLGVGMALLQQGTPDANQQAMQLLGPMLGNQAGQMAGGGLFDAPQDAIVAQGLMSPAQARQARQFDDPQQLANYLRGVDTMTDDEKNMVLNQILGGSHRTLDDPGGWSNWFVHGRSVDPSTGQVKPGWYDRLFGS